MHFMSVIFHVRIFVRFSKANEIRSYNPVSSLNKRRDHFPMKNMLKPSAFMTRILQELEEFGCIDSKWNMVEMLQDFLMKKQTTTEFYKNVSIIPISKANDNSTKWQSNINGSMYIHNKWCNCTYVASCQIADLMLSHLVSFCCTDVQKHDSTTENVTTY